MKERGTYIKNEDWEGMNKVNKELIKMVCEEQRPCTCFIVLEDEESVERALEYNNVYNEENKQKLLGEFIQVEPACEPSDIIWENCAVSKM